MRSLTQTILIFSTLAARLDSTKWFLMRANCGSGKKAYRPDQTVAGKTGTCIGQGAWLGLFTSYAPVVNPRLAVVVITRGTDAHKHLPAAVAGNIYRSLGPRFGTNINFQVAEADEGD